MEIKLKEVSVRDLVDRYNDDGEGGVVGYSGKLNIRPKYQREFIYKQKQQDAVIETVSKDFPLNTMYWVKSGDDTYEVLDGQQRTLSICSYVNGDFSVDFRYFHNLEEHEQNQILDYKLMVYFCEGEAKEKLDWFQVINIAGEKLTKQELRNAIYTGQWLSDAKKHFSKTNGPAHNVGSDYLRGSAIRQDYLETAISWISNGKIEDYMSENQHNPTAAPLWSYFQSVITWVESTFPNYRKEMKGINWGALYNNHKDDVLDPNVLEEQIKELLQDEDVTKNAGIYTYLLTGETKHMSLRAFTDKQKRMSYESQEGVCPSCENHFDIKGMEGDHIIPWSKGGKTDMDNLQMLCKKCNGSKSNK